MMHLNLRRKEKGKGKRRGRRRGGETREEGEEEKGERKGERLGKRRERGNCIKKMKKKFSITLHSSAEVGL